jgi:hypothetical protein
MNTTKIKNISKKLKINNTKYPIKTLIAGFSTEKEHGKKAGKYNVTNDNAVMTLKIAMAHLTENPNYYKILKKAKL